VFDHTSVIRFLEARFGVAEPNISPWRRAVCGDLTSAFNFATPNVRHTGPKLPATAELAHRAAALPKRTTPPIPATPGAAVQAHGPRPARPLPYALDVRETAVGGALQLEFANTGKAGAVLHVYDRRNLDAAPRRYTVEAGKTLRDQWDSPAHDLWVLGPNGFHRHLIGLKAGDAPVAALREERHGPNSGVTLTLTNPGDTPVTLQVRSPAYAPALKPWRVTLKPQGSVSHHWSLKATGGWYDLAVSASHDKSWLRRLSGHVETGRASVTDPAMHGPARLQQWPTAV
jgi:phospholipase C